MGMIVPSSLWPATGRPRGLLGEGPATMRALLLPTVAILALATGAGLLGIAATVAQAPVTVAPAAASTEGAEAVRRFYAAAGEALRTGNATALRDAVAPDYVEQTSPTITQTGVDGYVRFLAELRAVCPDCRLAVEELAIGNDQAAVRVTAHGHRQGTFLGASLDGLPFDWSALDTLRIAEGRVAERWSQGDPLSLMQSLFADVPVELPAGPATLQVSRLILRSGDSLPPLAAAGPLVLVVETGELSVRTDGAVAVGHGRDVAPVDTVLRQGERFVVGPGLHHAARNAGPTPAVVLVVAIDPVYDVPPLSGSFARP
jgi:predicted ester cyclase